MMGLSRIGIISKQLIDSGMKKSTPVAVIQNGTTKKQKMNAFLILKYFHILLFVFWLGTDMGTYYSSKFVINPKLSAPQRATALQILLGCDLGPRIAMPRRARSCQPAPPALGERRIG